MNIFALDPCPVKSAQYLDDKRVIKMILESAQLISTAIRGTGVEVTEVLGETYQDIGHDGVLSNRRRPSKWFLKDTDIQLFKPTHPNHPSTLWTAKSRHNADWLYRHAMALCIEYTNRFGKIHKTESVVRGLKQILHLLPDVPFTDPANCARRADLGIDFTHIKDVYKAYRLYLHTRFQLEYNKPRVTPRYYRSKNMFNVSLKKIESFHSNLRTPEVTGTTFEFPQVGASFFMYTDALEDGDIRFINTSVVKEVRELSDGEIVFKTQNSTYSLSLIVKL